MDNKPLKIISYIAIMGFTLYFGSMAINYLVIRSEKQFEKENVAILPTNDIPPVINEIPNETSPDKPMPEIITSFLQIIKSEDNYQINKNPYDIEIYEKMSRRLALFGNFDIAELHIKAILPTEDEHFLSINIGTESGVYNAVRNSSTGLDISLTKENRGIFDKKNPIDIKIDLLGQQTLATTREEFLATRKATKLIRFWDFIRPQAPAPSVSRVLATPFNKDGVYVGTIESMSFEYKCKEENDCKVAVCENDELTTKCLLDNFGEKAKNEWIEWYKK